MKGKKKQTKKGKGLISDVYQYGLKYLGVSGETKPGELHVPQINENISLKNPLSLLSPVKFAQYEGPKTNLISRIKESSWTPAQQRIQNKNLTFSDLVSKKHDIQYQISKTQDDIRKADNDMLNTLSKKLTIKDTFLHPLSTLNSAVAFAGIESKKIGEKLGLSQYGLSQQRLKKSTKKKLYENLKSVDEEIKKRLS